MADDQFTGAAVREMAKWLLNNEGGRSAGFSFRRCVSMLAAYADRLEQDEQRLNMARPGPIYVITPDDQRKEGRLEVFCELAKVNPFNTDAADYHLCNFCGGPAYGAVDAIPRHKPDCLFVRATAALRETTPTP